MIINLNNVHYIWKSSFGSLMVLDSVAVFWIAALGGAVNSVYELLRSNSKNLINLISEHTELNKNQLDFVKHASLLGDDGFSVKLQLLVFGAEPE